MLGDVVGADVDCGGGRGGDHLDGHGLAVGASDAVGLAFGGLDDELEVGHVGRNGAQTQAEPLPPGELFLDVEVLADHVVAEENGVAHNLLVFDDYGTLLTERS